MDMQAYQNAAEYFMVRVTDPDGNIIWSSYLKVTFVSDFTLARD